MTDAAKIPPEKLEGTRLARLCEVAVVFLRFGTTAFGGPAAHIGMMEDEFVRRRGWISQDKFLDLLGAVNLIPGPNSTEMAIYLGYLRAGWAGLLIAGTCFILPAMLMVTAIAWAYVRFGTLPQFAGLLYGVKPVVIAIILQALWRLGRRALKTWFLAALAAVAATAGWLGKELVDPITVILVTGVISGGQLGCRLKPGQRLRPIVVMLAAVGAIVAFNYSATSLGNVTEAQVGLGTVFLYFLKVGAVLYGTGYVLLAVLQADLVARWHWLTAAQLLDATAVGQVTPGPLFTTATFIGFFVGGLGLPGAVVATIAIFLPSFIFIALGGPLISRLRESPVAGAFLDGVNVASLALMAVVTWQLGRAALVDVPTLLLALASAVLLVRFRVNSAWLVLGGAAIGMLSQMPHVGG